MSTALELAPSGNLTAVEIRAQVNLIQEVMRAVMKDGTHFGTIPGTPKPTLYKAGSEKILSTFRIGCDPEVEDLSIPGDEARFRVRAKAVHQATGAFLGAGVGECSSNEEKYRWRAAVCQEEFDETPEDMRRDVWKKGRDGPYKVKQVRTNPADVANTILKMAKKRAQIDMTLTVTAASDVFAQDIEDLPEELRPIVTEDENGQRRTMQAPQRRSAAGAAYTGPLPEGVVRLVKVDSKGGTKANGEPFTKFTIMDSAGRKFGTFSETDADTARKYIAAKTPVSIEFATGKYGPDLKKLTVWQPPVVDIVTAPAASEAELDAQAAAESGDTRQPGEEG